MFPRRFSISVETRASQEVIRQVASPVYLAAMEVRNSKHPQIDHLIPFWRPLWKAKREEFLRLAPKQHEPGWELPRLMFQLVEVQPALFGMRLEFQEALFRECFLWPPA